MYRKINSYDLDFSQTGNHTDKMNCLGTSLFNYIYNLITLEINKDIN